MTRSNWTQIKAIVAHKHLRSDSWKSDQVTLRRIFEYAEANGIEPCETSMFSISKFRDVIKEIKGEIANENPAGVAELFRMTVCHTNANLRLAVGKVEPEEVRITTYNINGEEVHTVLFSKEQLDRVQKSTKSYFTFIHATGTTPA